MNPLLRSLLFAFASLLHPRMLWLMIWPMLIAVLIWGVALASRRGFHRPAALEKLVSAIRGLQLPVKPL